MPKPVCSGVTQAIVAGEFAFRAVPCHRQRGLSFYVDADGVIRWACKDHRRAIERRYPPAAPISESEMRALWGDR